MRERIAALTVALLLTGAAGVSAQIYASRASSDTSGSSGR